MSDHTPGPWQLEGEVVSSESNKVIHVPPWSPRHPELHANAQLIAAAPDLLAACERVIEAEWGNAHEKTLEIVRAAVAKALGEDNV